MKLRTIALLLVLSSFLSGCGLFGGDEERDEFAGLTNEEQFYRRALDQLNGQNFTGAIATYQGLESRFPFGRFAEQSQIEIVYAYYRNSDVEAARAAADRFIRLHPDSDNIDYAYYMKGLAAYDIEPGFFSRFIPSDDTKRDVSHIQTAFAEFAQLLARFPDSAYAPDARQRMVHMRNMLARNEIHVANYYFRRGAYMAALNRGKYVVEHMQQTPSVADGLAIMGQAYLLLGLNDLAEDSIAVLCENYPDHPNLMSGCEFDSVYTMDGLQRSWINQATLGLFDPPKPPQFNYRPKT